MHKTQAGTRKPRGTHAGLGAQRTNTWEGGTYLGETLGGPCVAKHARLGQHNANLIARGTVHDCSTWHSCPLAIAERRGPSLHYGHARGAMCGSTLLAKAEAEATE